MSTAKNQLNQIVENQTKLAETLTANAKEAAKVVAIDETLLTEAKALFNEYTTKNKELFETIMKPESVEKIWEKMPDTYSKAVGLQVEYFNKTMDFYRQAFNASLKNVQESAQKISEIYKNNYEAMTKTAEANVKIFAPAEKV